MLTVAERNCVSFWKVSSACYVIFPPVFICCSEDKIIALYKQLTGLGRGYAIVKYVSWLLTVLYISLFVTVIIYE